jgi:hypothetical protein
MEKRKKSIYYKGTLDLAGNIAGLATGASLGDTIKVFSVPFSQFIKSRMSLNIIYNWVVKTISQQNYCWSWICLWEFE